MLGFLSSPIVINSFVPVRLAYASRSTLNQLTAFSLRLIEFQVQIGLMKPQLLSLPRAGRLRIPVTSKTAMQTGYGARSYMRTAQIARKCSLSAQGNRCLVSASIRSPVWESRRWITQKYLQKVKAGEEQWAQFAAEIKAGKRKSFVEHLEERGLIHDVVG